MSAPDERFRPPSSDVGADVERPSRAPFLALGVVVGPLFAWVLGEADAYLAAADGDRLAQVSLAALGGGMLALGAGTALSFGGGHRGRRAFALAAILLAAALPAWFDRPGRLALPLLVGLACALFGRWRTANGSS